MRVSNPAIHGEEFVKDTSDALTGELLSRDRQHDNGGSGQSSLPKTVREALDMEMVRNE